MGIRNKGPTSCGAVVYDSRNWGYRAWARDVLIQENPLFALLVIVNSMVDHEKELASPYTVSWEYTVSPACSSGPLKYGGIWRYQVLFLFLWCGLMIRSVILWRQKGSLAFTKAGTWVLI